MIIAASLALMGLRHVVITSVNRDELPDGGAAIWATSPASRCTVTVPVDASFGYVLMALTVQGVRVTMSDRHLSITGAISSIKGCEKERRKDRYTIARGEIRDPEKDLAPDVLTSPDPSGAPRGAVLAIEPPVQKGPFEWVMTDATAAEARRAGWQWLMKSEKAPARVPAIPPGSLAGKLGLVEGDVILSLNGYSLTDPDTTVEAYAKTARGKAFVLTVERAGKKLDLKYTVE